MMLSNYHMIVFSNFVDDPQVKANFGISAISLVTLDIIWVTMEWAKDQTMLVTLKVKKDCVYGPKQKKLREEKERN